jgi:hypothetical protein
VETDQVIPCERLRHVAILPRQTHFAEGFYARWNRKEYPETQ